MTNKNYYLLGFIFSLTYIFLEITFNIGLVDFINSKNTEISVFDKLETLGRVLSSIGFSLFIVKLINSFIGLKKNFLGILFIAISGVFYFGETVIFNKIIDNLSTEQKFNAYSFGVYRNLNLNNQIESKIFENKDKEYDLVINSMFGLLANNPEIKNEVENDIKKFFAIEMNVDSNSLGDIYDKIQLTETAYSGQYDDFWKLYVIESRRYENYNGIFKKKYKENFIKTIGIEPSLDKESFIIALKLKSKNSSNAKINDIEIIKQNDKLHMSALKLGDIPKNLNKGQWVSFIQNHVQKSIDSMKLEPKNIDNLPHARNIISSVVITPIALILSLISIGLNIILLIGKFSKIGGVVTGVIILTIASFWTFNPYHLNPLLNKIIGLETRFISVLNPYKNLIHNTFVNDKNPNLFDIVRIEKPKIPPINESANELNKKFEALKNENNKSDQENDDLIKKQNNEIYVDDKKLNNNGYYGELNKKNPYAK